MNPFDDPDGVYSVLVNDEHRHSLWPSGLPIPDGWRVVHDNASLAACVDYIERNWTDPTSRPKK